MEVWGKAEKSVVGEARSEDDETKWMGFYGKIMVIKCNLLGVQYFR